MQDQIKLTKIRGIHTRFTWTHFLLGMLGIGGVGFAMAVIGGSATAIAFAILVGAAMISLTIAGNR